MLIVLLFVVDAMRVWRIVGVFSLHANLVSFVGKKLDYGITFLEPLTVLKISEKLVFICLSLWNLTFAPYLP